MAITPLTLLIGGENNGMYNTQDAIWFKIADIDADSIYYITMQEPDTLLPSLFIYDLDGNLINTINSRFSKLDISINDTYYFKLLKNTYDYYYFSLFSENDLPQLSIMHPPIDNINGNINGTLPSPTNIADIISITSLDGMEYMLKITSDFTHWWYFYDLDTNELAKIENKGIGESYWIHNPSEIGETILCLLIERNSGGGDYTIINEDIISIESNDFTLLPSNYELAQNYPNPFNPKTTIKYQLPEATLINLNIYNIKGQLVKTLVDEMQDAGYYNITWDGCNNDDKELPSGLYIYRLSGEDYIESKRMLLLK